MKLFTNAILFTLLLLLGACTQKQSPEEVAHGFWGAIVSNDLDAARKLATKDSQDKLDLLGNPEKMLKAVEVGTATTTGTQATVPTTLIGDANGSETRVELTTYLRQEDDAWKVEGGKTVNALVTSSLETMMQNLTGDLAEIGGALNKTITTGLQEFLNSLQKSVPEIKQELGKLADEDKARELGQELGTLFSQGLRDAMQEFSKGLEGLEKELHNSTQQQQGQ